MPINEWHIDLRHTSYEHSPPWSGHYVKLERDEAIPLMTEAYERTRLHRAGMITRTAKRWLYEIHPVETKDEFFVIYMEGDDALAYARYTIDKDPNDEFKGTMHVIEAVAVNRRRSRSTLAIPPRPRACRRSQGSRTSGRRPAGLDARRAATAATHFDGCDMAKVSRHSGLMLERRTYAVEDALVIQVVDAETKQSTTLSFECGPEGGRCTDTDTSPDLTMNEAELAAIYMGAVECSMLANIGLVDVAARTPDAAFRADAIFRTTPAGWNPYHF